LKRSLCFSNVRVHSYSYIEEAVMLPNVEVGRHCTIKKVVLDRGCIIPEGMEIGVNHEHDRARGFRVSSAGVVLVTPDMLEALAASSTPTA